MLVDLYHESDDAPRFHRVFFFDIEVETSEGLPDIKKAQNKITAISFYDQAADEYYVYILDEEGELTQTRNGNEEIVPFKYEEDLLMAFLQKWEEIRPTIITGWNIDNFDVPYLYRRIVNVLGNRNANRLSEIGEVFWNEHRRRYFIAGVSCLDYLALYRNFTFSDRPSYSLDAISKTELGEGKVEYQGSLNKLIKEDINKFIEYSLQDTVLVYKLDKKMNFIELVLGVCHKGHVPLEDVYYSSRWIEGAMLVYMKKLGFIAPNKNPKNRDLMNGDDRFSGAYVKSPESDKYYWIYDLDFTSLYPSLVISLNISPETKIGKIDGWNSEVHLHDKDRIYSGVISGDNTEMRGTEIDKMMDKYNLAISDNGVLYEQDKKGIIPQILEEWFKDKENYDKLMKQYGKKGDKEKSKYYKQRRTIAKVMLNSVYGVLGLPVFRFYDLDNAEAVTTTGVSLIKFAEKMANYYYNNKIGSIDKDYCIYIDTDSLFLLAEPIIKAIYPDTDTENVEQMSSRILEVVGDIQKYLNKSLDLFAWNFLHLKQHTFDIKQEVIARSGLWVAKKRYAMWITNDSGVSVDEIMFKGVDVVRSSFPQAFRTFMRGMIEDMLKTVPQDEIDEKLIKFKEHIKTVALDEISMPTSVKNITKYGIKDRSGNMKFGKWIKGSPVHVKASISYNEFLVYHNLDKNFAKIGNGEKIKYAYLKTNPLGIDGLAFRGYDDPKEILEYIKQYIDREKIFERILLNKILQFYNALNWVIPSKEQRIMSKYFEF